MQPADPIADYGAAIARELCFDAKLARRVRAEVEDHLQEWLAASGDAGSHEAQESAIRAFGHPSELARAFVPGALASLARRAAALVALAVIGIFVVMDARVVWYGWMQWHPGEQLRATNAIALPADRLAFVLAFILSLAALLYAMTRRAPTRSHASFGREIRRCIRLGAATLAALSVAVAIELVLTGIRFAETALDGSVIIPTLSLTAEASVAVGCIAYLWISARRVSLALRLAGE